MPEADASFSVLGDAAIPSKAGFPLPGNPPLRPHRRVSSHIAVAAAILCLGVFLSLPAHAANRNHRASGHKPFGLAEAAMVDDAALREELTAISHDFYKTVTAKTAARFAHSPHRNVARLLSPGSTYLDAIRSDAISRLRAAQADLSRSQYFVYADRNPDTQIVFLAFYDAKAQTVRLLGDDFISSGKLRSGKDSFLTPLGVFENLPDNWGYRAQGTKNDKGWRGLGAQGSRVWDFGYQQAPRRFRQGVYDSQMRLLMHATDPDQGEPRLGGPDSKGCVRISAAANSFFDRYAILDRLYEQLATADTTRDMWLLRSDRTPTLHSGSYLVVGDSAVQSAAR